ncbi:hypothetical protein Rsub_03612 [Raphidocelis subcapitata]|uniref:Uncharacterized protein n=1 Tax=Raphidocelis subcapitata TaxID=307507 RepID=A0A2V0NX87_9CHLO|nr:hypothetical protein Rsub_03612 [Raphidocelis subcapitata]|eukprot:GBF91292.1 hypothetical protein Rsub_03612 [Raphidocelis subcapitata]
MASCCVAAAPEDLLVKLSLLGTPQKPAALQQTPNPRETTKKRRRAPLLCVVIPNAVTDDSLAEGTIKRSGGGGGGGGGGGSGSSEHGFGGRSGCNGTAPPPAALERLAAGCEEAARPAKRVAVRRGRMAWD